MISCDPDQAADLLRFIECLDTAPFEVCCVASKYKILLLCQMLLAASLMLDEKEPTFGSFTHLDNCLTKGGNTLLKVRTHISRTYADLKHPWCQLDILLRLKGRAYYVLEYTRLCCLVTRHGVCVVKIYKV